MVPTILKCIKAAAQDILTETTPKQLSQEDFFTCNQVELKALQIYLNWHDSDFIESEVTMGISHQLLDLSMAFCIEHGLTKREQLPTSVFINRWCATTYQVTDLHAVRKQNQVNLGYWRTIWLHFIINRCDQVLSGQRTALLNKEHTYVDCRI